MADKQQQTNYIKNYKTRHKNQPQHIHIRSCSKKSSYTILTTTRIIFFVFFFHLPTFTTSSKTITSRSAPPGAYKPSTTLLKPFKKSAIILNSRRKSIKNLKNENRDQKSKNSVPLKVSSTEPTESTPQKSSDTSDYYYSNNYPESDKNNNLQKFYENYKKISSQNDENNMINNNNNLLSKPPKMMGISVTKSGVLTTKEQLEMLNSEFQTKKYTPGVKISDGQNGQSYNGFRGGSKSDLLEQDDHSRRAGIFIQSLLQRHHHELSMRPRREQIVSEIFIKIESISEISEVNMDMTVTMTIRQVWRDQRLDLTKQKLDLLVLPPSVARQLWIPDLFIEGSKSSFIHKTIEENVAMRVRGDGIVDYTTKLSATMLCEMELYYFPLDRETCNITIQSFGYYDHEVSLRWDELQSHEYIFANKELLHAMPKFSLKHYSLNIENKTMHEQIAENVTVKRCKNQLVIQFEFERYFISVFFHSYFPAQIMVVLAGLSMWVDANSVPARIGMGVTTILTISTLIQGLKSSLPKVAYLTALDIYLWVCFFFVFSATCEYCLLNYWMTLDAEIKANHMCASHLNRSHRKNSKNKKNKNKNKKNNNGKINMLEVEDEANFPAFDGLQSSSTRTIDSIKYIDKQSEEFNEEVLLRKRLNIQQTVSDEDLQR